MSKQRRKSSGGNLQEGRGKRAGENQGGGGNLARMDGEKWVQIIGGNGFFFISLLFSRNIFVNMASFMLPGIFLEN